jgi:small subunit ribosomal protein S1
METGTEKKTISAMEQLISEHEDLLKVPPVGEIITGHILDKGRNAMYLDVGALGVGVIYGRELFDDLDTYKSAKIGDPVQAAVVNIENEEGYVELSLRSATRERSWDELRRKMENGDIFETEILDANKGGLIARVNGVMGFIPVSQLAPDHYPRVEGGDKSQILGRLKEYVGQRFKVKVITASQTEEKLIVSEKAAVGDELSETLMKLNKGAAVSGLVSGIADFGVFVKFMVENQELEGLVHISELAWQRIDNPSDIVQVGEKVEAKVIGVDGLRISLSMKQLREDPWSTVKDRYAVGDTVSGEILKVTAFGGFVKLDKDIHGLVHVSELPKDAQADPAAALLAGEKYSFKIISLEPSEHRLGLSLNALQAKDEKKAAKETKVAEAKEEEKKEVPAADEAKEVKKPKKGTAKKATTEKKPKKKAAAKKTKKTKKED